MIRERTIRIIYFFILICLSIGLIGCTKTDNTSIDEILFNPSLTYGTLKDICGNTYKTIKIDPNSNKSASTGSQVWMAENLKTTKYNDGSSIPFIHDNEIWDLNPFVIPDTVTWYKLRTPGYCWYMNDEDKYKDVYGALYNAYVINTGKLCPAGWHVPSKDEWITLGSYLGGLGVAGDKMKETGTNHWISPNTLATNSSGFTGFPVGYRTSNGNYFHLGNYAYWWSSTIYSTTSNWSFYLQTYSPALYTDYVGNTHGHSVRCVQD